MSNTIIYGIIATFIVLILSVCFLLFFVKLYRPTLKISKYFVLGLVCTFVTGLAAMQVISSYSTEGIASEGEMKYYQVSSWIAEEDPLFGTIEAKNLWSSNPTIESKFLYALALLKNGQEDKAAYLLQELGEVSSRYVKTDDIVGAIQDIEHPIDSYVAANDTVLPEVEYNEAVKKRLEDMRKRLYDDLNLSDVEAEAIIVYAPERYQYLVSRGAVELHVEVDQFFVNQMDGIQNAYVKRELAQTGMAAGLHHYSEALLVDLAKEYPNDEETILHLSELYLSGYLPGEEAATLKHVSVTTLRMDQERIEAFDEWNGSEAEITEYQNLYNEQQKFSNEIAYTLLSGVNSQSDNPIIDVRMARYYFNAGENDQAEEKMNEALEQKQELPVDVQYTLSQMEQNLETGHLASDLEQKQEQSQRLFNGLHVALNQGSLEDTSFSVFLSNSIENHVKKDINIISVEAKTDGTVHVYVEAENINLNEKMLELLDNNAKISDFTVTKVDGSAGDIARSIGLVMDVSGSMAGSRLEASKQAVEHFVNGMRGFEQADLVSFSSSPSVVHDFTTDKGPLVSKAHQFVADGGTNITDSLIMEINRLKNEPGQRILFIMTDGEDENFESEEVRSNIVSLAKRYGISIYSMGLGAGNLALQDVTGITGGKYVGSPYESGMISGFEEVSNQLDNMYRITYTLDPVEYGWHDFNLSSPEHEIFYESYPYYLSEESAEDSDEENGNSENVTNPTDQEKVEKGFYVRSIYPAHVPAKAQGETEFLLEGEGFKKADAVIIGDLTIKDLEKGKTSLRFHVPNDDLNVGTHKVTVVSETGGKSSVQLNVVDASLASEIPYGWATLYADHIRYIGDRMELTGNISVDRFLYPSSSTMTLTLDNELTFNGLKFNIYESKMDFFSASRLANPANDLIQDIAQVEFTFKPKDSIGEEFEVTSWGNFNKKFPGGLEVSLRDFTYQAKYEKAPGTFKAISGITGLFPYLDNFANGKQINKTIGSSTVNILGIEGKLGLEIEPDKVQLTGEGFIPEIDAKVIKFGELTGKFEVDDISKRWAIDANVEDISIFEQNAYVKGMGLTFGHEANVGFRIGARVNGNFDIGTTGIALNKLGFVLDWTSNAEGSLEANVGTALDDAFEKLLKKIDDLPFISLNTENPYILAIETGIGVKNFKQEDWEAHGNLKGVILGFPFKEYKARLNRNFLEFSMEANIIGATYGGKQIIEFQNPRHARHLTVGMDGNLEVTKKVNLKLDALAIPRDMHIERFRIKGKLGFVPIDFDYSSNDTKTYQ